MKKYARKRCHHCQKIPGFLPALLDARSFSFCTERTRDGSFECTGQENQKLMLSGPTLMLWKPRYKTYPFAAQDQFDHTNVWQLDDLLLYYFHHGPIETPLRFSWRFSSVFQQHLMHAHRRTHSSQIRKCHRIVSLCFFNTSVNRAYWSNSNPFFMSRAAWHSLP